MFKMKPTHNLYTLDSVNTQLVAATSKLPVACFNKALQKLVHTVDTDTGNNYTELHTHKLLK